MGATPKQIKQPRRSRREVKSGLKLLVGWCAVFFAATTVALLALPPSRPRSRLDDEVVLRGGGFIALEKQRMGSLRAAAAKRRAAAAAVLSVPMLPPSLPSAVRPAAARPAAPAAAAPGSACTGVLRWERTDLVGEDVASGGVVRGARFDDCCAACRAHPMCTSFVHKLATGWCYLKAHVAGGTNARRESFGLTAGVMGGAEGGAGGRTAIANAPPPGGVLPGISASASAGAAPAGDGDAEWAVKRAAVVGAFRHAWKGYEDFSWGRDTLKPITKTGEDWFGLGLTLIDGLDTMWLMGMQEEFARSRAWVATHLEPSRTKKPVNLFETTIRVLGGLLSAHALSNDAMFLAKAVELGERLLPAFATQSGIPFSDVDLANGRASSPSGQSSLAEVTTVQMEFKYLAFLTNRSDFYDVVHAVSEKIALLPKEDGLAPMFLNHRSGAFISSRITLGARGDSYYEYLLKQYLVTGKEEGQFKQRWEEAVRGIEKRLIRTTKTSQLTYVAELSRPPAAGAGDRAVESTILDKMDHLVCFLPGSLALGAMHGVGGGMHGAHMALAKALTRTCAEMYRTPAGLAPEIVYLKGRAPKGSLPPSVPSIGLDSAHAPLAKVR